MKPGAVVAVVVVAVALIAPSSGVAHANPVNWDALAQCESDGNWSADTGNGFYGGLQISKATWRAHGGTGSPADASRAQQIQVAQRIVAAQGPGAWPTCTTHGRARSRAPVGSATHFMMYLVDQAAGILGR
ncbi:MAG TPA: transglycosylase family protein [Mycobacterium sp.]|nr:transglycosylase family protein [Mycobacterium sp.]